MTDARIDVRDLRWRGSPPGARRAMAAIIHQLGDLERVLACREWSRERWQTAAQATPEDVEAAVRSGLARWHGVDLIVEVPRVRAEPERRHVVAESTSRPAWLRCADCGALSLAAHVDGFAVRGCPSCGRERLEVASEHDAQLGDVGVTRIRRITFRDLGAEARIGAEISSTPAPPVEQS